MMDDTKANAEDNNHQAQGTDAGENVVAPEKPPVDEKSTHDGKSKRALHKEVERLREQLERLQSDFENQRERHLRVAAEFENYRKRNERDFQSRVLMSLSDFYVQLLPVVDDLERSVASLRAAETDKQSLDATALLSGLELILQNFRKLLELRGIKTMETVGTPFDPTRHDALTQVEDSGQESQMVLEEHVKGYMLNDRVLRPAKVIISK